MNAESVRKIPWVSCLLLIVAYACLGWLLASPTVTNPSWLSPACLQTVGFIKHALSLAGESQTFCGFAIKENLLGAVLAFSWVVVASTLFISPLTNFNRFINRWFKSDTVAFLTVCVIAGMLTFILFWLQLFLHISAILACEALARIDLQTIGLNKSQAFWSLLFISLVGLGIGWVTRLSV